MLLHMLLPSHLKGKSLKKYYDWAAQYELRELAETGIDGVRVIHFGATLDTPGRSELLNMQSSASYQGCPFCFHAWDRGLRIKPDFCGARSFLPLDSPWREAEIVVDEDVYMFKCVETRSPPLKRTTQTTAECVACATAKKPFCGHKGTPMQSLWPGFHWDWCLADWMHDLKCFCVMCLRTLVGNHSSHGMYKGWDYDVKHREECEVNGIFPQVWDLEGSLPWRLTREQVQMLDERVRRMWWPHYRDKLHSKGFSFWKKTKNCWKSKHKLTILLVLLPTLLCGCVPAVHRAIMKIVFALRRLDGLVLSLAEAKKRGVQPESHVLPKGILKSVNRDLILGIVMLEGCFPVSILNTTLHHILHYGEQTDRNGCLRWFT